MTRFTLLLFCFSSVLSLPWANPRCLKLEPAIRDASHKYIASDYPVRYNIVGHPQTAKLQKTPPSEVLDFQASQNVPLCPPMFRYNKKGVPFFCQVIFYKKKLIGGV
jgi:hypothetical protein